MSKKRKFGWLTPSGRFVECGSYQHVDVASADFELRAIPAVSEIIEELQFIEDDCYELAEKEGTYNAEWHHYDMARDDARVKIVRALYNAKCIRVGEHDSFLHFEGYPNVLKKRHQECVDFAEQYGMNAVFEPQRKPS